MNQYHPLSFPRLFHLAGMTVGVEKTVRDNLGTCLVFGCTSGKSPQSQALRWGTMWKERFLVALI